MKIDLKLTYFRSGVPVDFAESQEDFDRITEGLPTVLCPRCDGMGGTSMGRCTFCFGEGEALDAGNYHYWVADGDSTFTSSGDARNAPFRLDRRGARVMKGSPNRAAALERNK